MINQSVLILLLLSECQGLSPPMGTIPADLSLLIGTGLAEAQGFRGNPDRPLFS
jgi:hypothetical protein